MNITTKSTIKLTPALETYIESKFAPLGKFVKHLEEAGELELRLDIGRTTRHQKKGEVFVANVSLRLPKKVIRAEGCAEDVRTAIDQAKNTLRLEIEKNKAKGKPKRGKRE